MRRLAYALLALNPVLWATFYTATKAVLIRVDPIRFSCLELSVAAAPALCLLALRTRRLSLRSAAQGASLGGLLFVSLLCTTIALRYTTATDTGFFPALNGAFAVLYIATIRKQPVPSRSWTAAIISTVGALLLIFRHGVFGASPGDALAFLGALVYAAYIFAVEARANDTNDPISVFCIETLIMWVLSVIVAGVVDGWRLEALSARSALTIAYVGLSTTFAPTMIAITMQKFVPAITVAFLYVFEPIWSALFARLYLHEMPSVMVFVGGSLIVAGAVLHLAVASAQARRMPKAAAC